MANHGLGYSVSKIFIALFVLTAIEVAWAMPEFIRDSRPLLWGGLLLCAGLKGSLIFMYFMHMKYERWLVWSLVLPTPLLVLVIFGYVTPDVSFNARRDYPNGMMLNREGRIVPMIERISEAGAHGAAPHAAPAPEGAPATAPQDAPASQAAGASSH
jgi:cytochrome c oxidase subunit IV